MVGRDVTELFPKLCRRWATWCSRSRASPGRRLPRHLLHRPRGRDRRARGPGRRRPHRGRAGHLRRRPLRQRHGAAARGAAAEGQPPHAMTRGLALVPEDRRKQGLVLDASVAATSPSRSVEARAMRALWGGPENRAAQVWASRLQVKTRRSTPRPARSAAATSRRSCSPSGWPPSPPCSSSTSRPAASTSARRPRCTACSASSRSRASRSS